MAVLIAGLLIEAGALRFGIDDLDEGYFVQQATRVLHGQVPFRDFATLYSPGLLYLHAGLFTLFGDLSTHWATVGHPEILLARWAALLARAGLVLSLFAIARPFVRNPWWAAAPGLVLLLGLDDAPVRWEPHPGWLSTLFAVLAAWCLIHKPAWRWHIAAGALAGLSYAFKQNTGLFMLGAIVVWCGARQAWRPLIAFALVTLAWLAPMAVAVGDLRPLAPLVGGVNGASLFSPPEPTLLIPIAALAGGLWAARRDSDPRLRWLLLAGAALFLTELPRMDTLHLAWSAPLLLVVGAIVLDRQSPLIALAALVLAAVLVVPTVTERVEFFRQPLSSVDGVIGPTPTVADLEGAIEDTRARTTANEPIFVYPTSPLLYVLSGHPNPTRFDHLNPGAATPAEIQQVLADLERSHVRIVVVSDFWESVWGAPGANSVLESWINAHYREVARHGAYRVLVADL